MDQLGGTHLGAGVLLLDLVEPYGVDQSGGTIFVVGMFWWTMVEALGGTIWQTN